MNFEGKEEYVKDVFDYIAPYYDRMNNLMTWGLVKKWRNFMTRIVSPLPGEKILDIGAGTGEGTFLIAERVGEGGQVWGLDISEKMLAKARRKLAVLKPRLPVSFIRGNALKLPFPQESFDCITSSFVLRNVSSIHRAVSEMARVCKEGGRFACLEISRPMNPLYKAFFNIYFFHFIPWAARSFDRGKVIRGRYTPYTWLSLSLREFPQGKDMARVFHKHGFRQIRSYPLSYGAVTLYTGLKEKTENGN